MALSLPPEPGSALAAPPMLSAHLPELELALQDAVGSTPSALAAAARYVMGWEDEDGRPVAAGGGGKRIRPALCLFAAETLGGRALDAMPGAVAIELVHNFSLVHDEIQDHDLERHHRPTTWARLGEGQAINVGDFLYTRAVRALTDAPGDPARLLRALSVLHEAIGRMIEGQWQDLAFEQRESVGPDEYIAMVAGKTGALLGAPLEIGAILTGVPPARASLLGEWGRAVGLAFQVQDDYLGIWGDPGETGKSNTNDISRRKKTLPVVHALWDERAAATIRSVYAQPELGDSDILRVVEALESAGAPDACRAKAEELNRTSARLLAELELAPAESSRFQSIANYIINRRS